MGGAAGGTADGATDSAVAETGSGGGPAATSDAASASQPPDEPAFPARCDSAPAPRHEGAPIAEVRISPQLLGRPWTPDWTSIAGRRLRFPIVRFFVTHAVLRRRGAEPVLAEIVDGAGKVAPHGVHLFDAEDPLATTLRLRAPAAVYEEIALRIGLSPACNTGDPSRAVHPLNADGGMTWTWVLGYVLVKVEGFEEDKAAPGGRRGLAAHGGRYPPSTPPLRFVARGGGLTLPATAPRTLLMRLDDLVSSIDGKPDVVAGFEMMERLERADDLFTWQAAR